MSPRRPRQTDRLALTGLGVTVLGLAGTLHPVVWPPAAALAVAALGLACLLIAALLWARSRIAGSGESDDASRRQQEVRKIRAVSSDCGRVRQEMAEILAAGSGARRGSTERERAALDRYRSELRPLVLAVLDDAEAWCPVSAATRTLARGQTLRHVRMLAESLSDLDHQLNRSAVDRAA
jgi:hypothetical protein